MHVSSTSTPTTTAWAWLRRRPTLSAISSRGSSVQRRRVRHVTVAGRGGLCFVLSVVLVIVTAALKGAGSNPLAAAATPCGAVAAAEPQAGHTMPPAAPALFATDFPKLM